MFIDMFLTLDLSLGKGIETDDNGMVGGKGGDPETTRELSETVLRRGSSSRYQGTKL